LSVWNDSSGSSESVLPGHVCSIVYDFRTDLGQLTLFGPSPLSQDRTCVSGQTCEFGFIRGLGISESDRFTILETCGNDRYLDRYTSFGSIEGSTFDESSEVSVS
jgi:hypothetical protein